MNVTAFVNATYLKATGKVATFAVGSTKWNKILGIGNALIQTWEREPGVDWNSLYDPSYELTTIAETDTYELDDTIRKLSDQREDPVRIVHTDGSYTDYDIVDATTLRTTNRVGKYCAQIGRTIKFNKAFVETDPQFGGTLYVPKYGYATAITSQSDDVPVDDPQWLVIMSAAEYVRNDIVKQNQYPNLVNEANPLMESMKRANEAQIQQVIMPWAPAGMDW